MLPALLAGPVAAFFRDPERAVPDDANAVVAASDGKVLSVERFVDTRLGDEEFLRVAVFLSVLDVHVNRAPVAGRVVDYFVEDGGFAAAMKPEAEHNVAAYTVLETSRGTVVVAQRTGLIARRIVQRAPIGSMLARGRAVRSDPVRVAHRRLPAGRSGGSGRGAGRHGSRRHDRHRSLALTVRHGNANGPVQTRTVPFTTKCERTMPCGRLPAGAATAAGR